MLMPSIFGENLFDDFFTFERPQKQYEKEASCDLMKTDIREYEGGFELDINLPGCKKEDIQAELKDGTLTITAVSNKNTEEAAGRYIRRERFAGSCSRKFYVGEEITREDIRARFENGVLKLWFPKRKQRSRRKRNGNSSASRADENKRERGKEAVKTGGVPLTSFPGYDIFKRDLRFFYTDFTDILDFIKKE